MNEDTKKVFDQINKRLNDIQNGKTKRIEAIHDGPGHIILKEYTVWLDRDGREKEHPVYDCDCAACQEVAAQKRKRRKFWQAVLNIFKL